MRSESTAVFLHVNHLRPMWFFQTFNTLNVTFPVSRTQSSAPNKSYPDYEKKRERKFLEKWNKKDNGEPRDWLMYESEEGVVRLDRKESFIVGCAVLKLDNIKKHEQMQSHVRSSEIAFAILAPDKTAGQELRRQLTAAQAFKMSTMFQTSHALVLAKHFKPVIQSRLEVG